MRIAFRLLIAVLSLVVILSMFFFWLLVPVAGILMYFIVRYFFDRRRRRGRVISIREFRLAHEARARDADIHRTPR